MVDFATKPDRIASDRHLEAAARLADITCEAEIAHTVWSFGELAKETTGVSNAWCTFQRGQAPPKRAN